MVASICKKSWFLQTSVLSSKGYHIRPFQGMTASEGRTFGLYIGKVEKSSAEVSRGKKSIFEVTKVYYSYIS